VRRRDDAIKLPAVGTASAPGLPPVRSNRIDTLWRLDPACADANWQAAKPQGQTGGCFRDNRSSSRVRCRQVAPIPNQAWRNQDADGRISKSDRSRSSVFTSLALRI